MNVYESIQELRGQGYGKRRAAKELTPNKRTVGKYWEMRELSYARYITDSSERAKILEPYREFIVGLPEKRSEINSSVIDGKLRMEYDGFEPSYRSGGESPRTIWGVL